MKPTCFGQSRVSSNSPRLSATSTQWAWVAMGLKGAGPNFQCSMQNKVLDGFVYEICKICTHTRQNPPRAHDKCSSAFALRSSLPTQGKLNLVSRRLNTSVNSSPRQVPGSPLKILDFPQPTIQKDFTNYFRDYVPNMTGIVKSLRDMMPLGKY